MIAFFLFFSLSACTNIFMEQILGRRNNGAKQELVINISEAPEILSPVISQTYFTVTVSGFTKNSDADAVILDIDIPDLSFTGHDTIGTAINGIKTFTIIVTYNGITEFPGGTADVTVNGLDNLSADLEYTDGAKTESIQIRDGYDSGDRRAIPVTQSNVTAFNSYAGTIDGLTRNYRQYGDIVLQNDWIPAGDDTRPFTGNYNGGSYKMSGLSINTASGGYTGMFGYIGPGGAVRYLNLHNLNIGATGDYAGSIAGYNDGIVEYCSATGAGEVSGDSHIGGIAGVNAGTIQYCFSAISIDGHSFTGGISGSNSGNIQNCYATGDITGSAYTGGVVGSNTNTVQYCYSESRIMGDDIAGGVAGENISILKNCVALNQIITANTNFGRIVGHNDITLPQTTYSRDDMAGRSWNNLGMDGVSIPLMNFETRNFWEEPINWTDAPWDFGNTWAWDAGKKRPVLQDLGGQ